MANSRADASRHTRRTTNPFPKLIFLALGPALVLGGLWRLTGSQDNSPAPAVDAIAVMPPSSPQTPVLSARRTPAVLSRETSAVGFEQALRPLGGAVLPGSCVAVSIDGVLSLSDGIDTPVTPASTTKFIVGAVALDVLGPTFTFTTEVKAEISGGAVGSIYLVGGGDPLLSSAWYPNDTKFAKYPQEPATSLEALADAVVAAGVTQINGNIVGDASHFDSELYAPSWPIEFRAIQGGPIAGLLVNDGLVFGDFSKSSDPAFGAARELARLLKERGVEILGSPTSGQAPVGLPTVASISSAPLVEIIGEMLRNSDNNTAEIILKEMGFRAQQAATRAAGISVVMNTLTAWGVVLDGVTFSDGSGLSRDNKVTCAAFLQILERFTIDDPIVSQMAVAGVSGTLANYFIGGPLEGRLHAKTGSLGGVKALVGYVEVDGGSLIRFVLLLETPGISEESAFKPLWEGVLANALGTYPTGPGAAEISPLSVFNAGP
ncbi:MAG: D-alanyl-D-alanine carboxypeptidase/D-alanyl-D-alanine-endopeptidase [Actinomycetes bacterium]